jgi:hypothetical protein
VGEAWHIYVLLDPRCGRVRYVGVTQNTKRRLRVHISTSKRGLKLANRGRWILGLLTRGLSPVMCVLESVANDWAAAEKSWIAHFERVGCKLVNSTGGGEGTPGHRLSQESKSKTSMALRGHPVSEQTRLRISAAQQGRKKTPEALRNARLAADRRAGVPRTAEVKAKISAAKMGHPGVKHTPETRARIAAALRGGKK